MSRKTNEDDMMRESEAEKTKKANKVVRKKPKDTIPVIKADITKFKSRHFFEDEDFPLVEKNKGNLDSLFD